MTPREQKAEVEKYLTTDRTLAGGRSLYNKLPGKSRAFQNMLVRFADTKPNLEKLYFELSKVANLPERNLKILLNKPLGKAEEPTASPEPTEELTLEDQLIAFDAKTADYQDAKKLAKGLELQPKSRKKADIYKALTEARTDLVKKK